MKARIKASNVGQMIAADRVNMSGSLTISEMTLLPEKEKREQEDKLLRQLEVLLAAASAQDSKLAALAAELATLRKGATSPGAKPELRGAQTVSLLNRIKEGFGATADIVTTIVKIRALMGLA